MVKDRESERKKSFLQARIRYLNSNISFDCLVRNISSTGAKLEFASPYLLPAEFDLEIPNKAVTLRCQLKWRTEEAVGVRFKGSVASGSS